MVKTKNHPEKPFRILSIDGGGIRGIIPLQILKEIESKTKKPISSLFDLIVGNSTGGIIALCLAAAKKNGHPMYTADDVLNLYLDNASTIFKKSFFRSLYTGFGLWAPKYNRKHLDSVLSKFFGHIKLDQVACSAVVTSYSLSNDQLSFWSSDRAKKHSDVNILMAEAAACTSAAPTFFAPKIISLPSGKKLTEVDGGIYANDPEDVAIMEAFRHNPQLQMDQIFILSLGTGRVTLKNPEKLLRNSGIIGWLLQVNLIDLILNADTEMGELAIKSSSVIERHRLQLNLNKIDSQMDNTHPQNLENLLKLSQNYIQESRQELDKICYSLLHK